MVDPEELALCRNEASEEELSKSRMKKRSVDILDKTLRSIEQCNISSTPFFPQYGAMDM